MMKRTLTIMALAALATTSVALAQRPGGGRQSSGDVVSRMLQLDKNEAGSLSRAEVTDARLKRILDRADADADGLVTREELTSLAASEPPAHGGGFGGPGGPGGGMMGGPPRPGEVLPTMLCQRLQLSAQQSTQLDQLQKEVDGRLNEILSAEQIAALQQFQQMGPGGPQGPGFGPQGQGGDGPGFGPQGQGGVRKGQQGQGGGPQGLAGPRGQGGRPGGPPRN